MDTLKVKVDNSKAKKIKDQSGDIFGYDISK
jgi:hypothetical protein